MRILLALVACLALAPNLSFADNGVERGLILDPTGFFHFSPSANAAIVTQLTQRCDLQDSQGALSAIVMPATGAATVDGLILSSQALLFNHEGRQVGSIALEIKADPSEQLQLEATGNSPRCEAR